MSSNEDELKRAFADEVLPLIAQLEQALRTSRVQVGHGPDVDAVFRLLHSIKGTAAFLNLAYLRDIAHRSEFLLAPLRKGEGTWTAELVRELLNACASLRYALPVAGTAHEGDINAGEGYVRVPVQALSTIEMLTDQHKERLLSEPESTVDSVQLLMKIRTILEHARMEPLGEVLRHYLEMVPEVAKDLGKEVKWELDGGHVLVDRRISGKLKEILVHLIRNSIDHGIESAKIRVQRGKPAEGQVLLKAYRSNGTIFFVLEDDGVGLSRSEILKKAEAQGLTLPPPDAPDADVWSLLFEPGFSTAPEITLYSGRGVGLDVVRQNIRDLGGDLKVNSRSGLGVQFEFSIPHPNGWFSHT